jgi:hypothetical protein
MTNSKKSKNQDLRVELLNVTYLQGKKLYWLFGSYSSNNCSSGTLNAKKM